MRVQLAGAQINDPVAAIEQIYILIQLVGRGLHDRISLRNLRHVAHHRPRRHTRRHPLTLGGRRHITQRLRRRPRTDTTRIRHVPLGHITRPLDPVPSHPAKPTGNIPYVGYVKPGQPAGQRAVRILDRRLAITRQQVRVILVIRIDRVKLRDLNRPAERPRLALNPIPTQLIGRVHPAEVRLDILNRIKPILPRQRPLREQSQRLVLVVSTGSSLDGIPHPDIVVPIRKMLRGIRNDFKGC